MFPYTEEYIVITQRCEGVFRVTDSLATQL